MGGSYEHTLTDRDAGIYRSLLLRDDIHIEWGPAFPPAAPSAELDRGLRATWARMAARGRARHPYLSLQVRIENLLKVYRPSRSPEVVRFVRDNPHLANLLEEAFPHIRRVFGNEADLSAEVVVEPDDPDFVELFVTVRMQKPPKEVLALLYHFQDTWFLDVLERTQGKLNFDVEST